MQVIYAGKFYSAAFIFLIIKSSYIKKLIRNLQPILWIWANLSFHMIFDHIYLCVWMLVLERGKKYYPSLHFDDPPPPWYYTGINL